MRRSAMTALLVAGTLLVGSGCAPGGSAWGGGECLDLPCGWEVKQGQLEPADAWHTGQHAMELTGMPVVVTRLSPRPPQGACLTFDMVADVDASARLELQLDFNDDGTVDFRAPVPAVHWKRARLMASTPREYASLRMILHKSGPGRAVIARYEIAYLRSCPDLPRIKLQDGVECSYDDTCLSGRCAQNRCGACGPAGCAEGQACRSDEECLDGACTGGLCRRCARQGTCGMNEPCTVDTQCASGACVGGSVPSMTRAPSVDRVCGECDADSDCTSGSCELGRCSECNSDADCAAGLTCRYRDPFDALSRACVPALTSRLPRGALCERDEECDGGLRCGAGGERAKRCGISCGSNGDCAPGAICSAPGAVSEPDRAPNVRLLPSWNEVSGRIATCHPTAVLGGSCTVHDQCIGVSSEDSSRPSACCGGRCSSDVVVDWKTGECVAATRLWPLDL